MQAQPDTAWGAAASARPYSMTPYPTAGIGGASASRAP